MRSNFAEQAIVTGVCPIEFRLRLGELIFNFDVAHPANHRASIGQVAGANAQLDERRAFGSANDRFLSGNSDQRAVCADRSAPGQAENHHDEQRAGVRSCPISCSTRYSMARKSR